MAEDNKTKFTIDLDSKDAIEKITGLKEAVMGLGEGANLAGFIENLFKIGEMAAPIILIYEALKATFEAVFDAERIQQINNQFETLTENAGLASSALKAQLEEASHGLIGETELLEHANTAMIKLGDNATHLGETMELARQISINMGGSVTDRFDQLNQAIATGNTRLLRQAGLFIDQKKVLQDYASGLGVSTEALTLQGKQHAILNATLAEGEKRFGDTDESVLKATNSWTQFKVAMQEVGEALAVAWEKIAGPSASSFMAGLADSAKMFKNYIVGEFGEGLEASEAKIANLRKEVNSLQKLFDNRSKTQDFANIFGGYVNWDKQAEKLEFLKAQLKQAEQEADALKAKVSTATKKPGGGGEDGGEINNQIAQKERIAFEQKLNAMVLQRMDTEKKVSTNIEATDRTFQEHSIQVFKQFQLQKEQIQNSVKKGDILGQQRADAQIVELEKTKVATLKKLNEQRQQDEIQVLQNIVNQNRDSAKGIAAAWQLEGKKADATLKDFGQTGEKVYSTLAANAAAAFEAMGQGQESAGDIAKKFLFGTLSDIAIAFGTVILSKGIGLWDPSAIAAGGALLVFGGVLKGLAGGGGSGVEAPSTPTQGGGAAVSIDGGQGGSAQPAMQEQAAMKKSVSIHIQGNYFDTDQTRMAIVQMVRDNQDATDFNVNKIGV